MFKGYRNIEKKHWLEMAETLAKTDDYNSLELLIGKLDRHSVQKSSLHL